ncbi:cysteine proteinase [Pluteus cervinus]|uniref:Cysteine proteinase n=1 Tax=Pluteus cervinus TaxID=181527 RepID=A0ACD3B590_9AGAR|nr:cysteine proteinase [Pluteus cervinus]
METEGQGCPHLPEYLAEPNREVILGKYKSVVSWHVYRLGVKNPAKRRKLSAPSCGTCDIALARPFACLHCAYTGCWSHSHVSNHLDESGHTLCADAKTGAVFCSKCDDFIYHATIDQVYLASVVTAEEKQTRFQVSKKPREPFKAWVPSGKENEELEGTSVVPCQGRRGLLNLGQTCFLNVVLQCLIHNPLLRNYFLSDKHNLRSCKLENCTCCEMDKLFTEVYSEDTTPYGPITFLSTTWRASSELAGYAQQDAHEFFISALNQIHSTSRGSTNVSCNCIIHSTFAGQLQSEVTCEKCGNVNTTVDPMLDISLELKGKNGGELPNDTLAACLRRFTQIEKLGPKEYSCGKCGKASHEASKRMSIRKLPPVLSFQFKRFEHKGADKSTARKIDSQIKFPAMINMNPYTTLGMKEANSETCNMHGPSAMYDYDLFAVINHEGQLNNGHYTNYARYQHEWYRFDDDKVMPSTAKECLNSGAYMCFYVKRHLDYKPYMTPSYVLTRADEAAREKEGEKDKDGSIRDKEKGGKSKKEDGEIVERVESKTIPVSAIKEREMRELQEKEKRERELEDDLLATV